jgi:hypothetical protein
MLTHTLTHTHMLSISHTCFLVAAQLLAYALYVCMYILYTHTYRDRSLDIYTHAHAYAHTRVDVSTGIRANHEKLKLKKFLQAVHRKPPETSVCVYFFCDLCGARVGAVCCMCCISPDLKLLMHEALSY